VTSVNNVTARHLDHLDSLRERHAYQLNSRVGCSEMRICITSDDQLSSFSPATCHQPLQLPGRWKFNVIISTRRFNFHCREVPRTVMHQRQYPEAFLD